MNLFPHQQKLETKWWHRLAQVFYYGVSAIWIISAVVMEFDGVSGGLGEFLEVIGGWIIFSAICYVLYWRGVVYIVYGKDQ